MTLARGATLGARANGDCLYAVEALERYLAEYHSQLRPMASAEPPAHIRNQTDIMRKAAYTPCSVTRHRPFFSHPRKRKTRCANTGLSGSQLLRPKDLRPVQHSTLQPRFQQSPDFSTARDNARQLTAKERARVSLAAVDLLVAEHSPPHCSTASGAPIALDEGGIVSCRVCGYHRTDWRSLCSNCSWYLRLFAVLQSSPQS